MMKNLFPFCVPGRSFGCISIWVNLADRNQMAAKHAKHAKFLKSEKYTHSNTWFFPHSTSITVLVTSAREAAEGKCEDCDSSQPATRNWMKQSRNN